MTRVTLGSSVPVRCKATFLKYCSGDFGLDLNAEYLQKLKQFPHLGLPQLSKTCFTICIMCMGEVWRRFTFERQCFPFKLFGLLNAPSDQQFLKDYRLMQAAQRKCPQCIDIEFSRVILGFIPPSMGQGQEAMHRAASLRDFLVDLAIFAPITADIVENLHGFCQAKLHRFRGMKPTEPVAQEVTLWGSITASFRAFRNSLWERIGDKVANNRLHRYGKQGQNQYSKFKENPQMKKQSSQIALPLFKLDMACAATPPKPKKLSGYLVPLMLWPCSFSFSVQVWGGFMFN